MEENGGRRLWFERLYAALGLPFWTGAVLFGAVGWVGLALGSWRLSGRWDYLMELGQWVYLPVLALVGVVTQVAARAATRRLEELHTYVAETLGGGRVGLRPLYRPRDFLLAYLVTLAVVQPLYTVAGYPGNFTLLETTLVSIPFLYANLWIVGYAWVWLFSSYVVYRMGRTELDPRPFSEDPSLGLRPLGSFSLHLTVSYVVVVAMITLPNLIVGASLPILAFLTGMFLLSIPWFLLPLLPLRSRLKAEKRALLAQVGDRYTRLVERIDWEADTGWDPQLVQELGALDQIRRDVREIYD